MPQDLPGVMSEFKRGKLHSGSKSGPVVKSRAQAIAIGISEQSKLKKKPNRGYSQAAALRGGD